MKQALRQALSRLRRSLPRKGGIASAALFLVIGGTTLTPRSAAADWLVLTNGSRVETKGPWSSKGKLLVFHLPNGTLSSLRASEVDLPASERLTAEEKAKAEAPPPPPPPPKPVVMTLTDADIAHPKLDEASGDEAAAGAATPAGNLSVTDWKQTPTQDGDGVEITGTLQNNGDQVAAGVQLRVALYDETGALIDKQGAVLTAVTLQAKGQTNFRAQFQGVYFFKDVKFETESQPVKLVPGPATRGEKPEGQEGTGG